MNRTIKLVVGLGVVVVCLVAAKALAAETAPATPPPGSTATQRLAQRKAERNIQLDAKETKRLTDNCTVAQSKIGVLKSGSNKDFADRKAQYQDIIGDVWVITGKLKIGGKDTFQLEKQLGVLTDNVNAFQGVVQNYQQTLDDIVVLNCQADVVGFKALLETARLYYLDLQNRSKSIHTYVTDTLKSTLTAQENDLQTSQQGSQ